MPAEHVPADAQETPAAGWTACDCIERIDKRLAEHNSRLVLIFPFSGGDLAAHRVRLQTEKVVPRKRDSMGAIASFCPFCGNSYEAPAQARGA